MTFIPTQQLRPGEPLIIDMAVYKKHPDVNIYFSGQPPVDLTFYPKTDTLVISANEMTPSFLSLPFSADGQVNQLFIRKKEMVSHTFTYRQGENDSLVVVMGGFNDWSRSQLKMDDQNGDGILEKTVFLDPIKHEYKLVVNGKELIDPENPVFVSNNIGGWNSILDLSAQQSPPPGKIFKERETSDRLTFIYRPPPDGALLTEISITLDNDLLHPDVYDLDHNKIVVYKGGLRTGRLRIAAVDERNRVLLENHTEIMDREPLNVHDHKDSWYFSILYSLMVDRFYDGNGENNHPIADPRLDPAYHFQGGDLAGLEEKLVRGYFRDLKVTSLWISPVQQQPDSAFTEFTDPHRRVSGYHGYWPVAARTIDPRFGKSDELKNIVQSAHDQEMKIILDFVSNHVHQDHPYFQKHRQWFGNVDLPDGRKNIRLWGEETRLTTWFDTFLPSFDYPSNPQAISQVTDDAVWWLTTYRFDGFRQDAVKHVPHRFWRELTSKMKTLNHSQPYFQIGETFGSDPLIRSYVNPGELDGQFNFSIYFNARGQFSGKKGDFGSLAPVIENNLMAFDPIHLMGNITSSHDQVRFMAYADGQLDYSDDGTERSFSNPPKKVKRNSSYYKLENFYALNISLPGIPVLYYGEEIGMMGAGDPDNRRMMRFGDDLSLREKIHKNVISDLNHLRRHYAALALGDLDMRLAEGPLMVLVKKYFNEEMVVVINEGPEETTVDLDPRYRYELLVSTREKSRVSGTSAILQPYSTLFASRLLK